jgi:CheY-like chemotaxis protein
MEGVRVLVVEDDQSIQRLVADVLEDEGYTVDVALDGIDALEQAHRALPHVVLLDLDLPTMPGPAFRQRLLDLDGGTETRIIVMTANGQAKEIAQRIGAHGVLTKPFDLDELLSIVGQAASAQD